MHPGSYTGLDFNAAGIAFLPKVARPAGPRFGAGRRPEPVLPDQSFDAVINVEASHIYPDFERFLGEVARVLRPGGHFRYADLGNRDGIPAWEAALASLPMRLVSRRVIDDQVLRGLHENSPRTTELINRNSPSFCAASAANSLLWTARCSIATWNAAKSPTAPIASQRTELRGRSSR